MNTPDTLASVQSFDYGQPGVSELTRQLNSLGLQPGCLASPGRSFPALTMSDPMQLSERYRCGAPTPWTSGTASEPSIVESLDGGAGRYRDLMQEAQRFGSSLTQIQHAKEAEAAMAGAQVQQQAMLQRLAQENAQLREHCQRLEAEKRVLKNHMMQAQFGGHQRHLSQPLNMHQGSQQDQVRLAHLARLMEAQQQRTRRRSMTTPSAFANPNAARSQQLQALWAAHLQQQLLHRQQEQMHHVRGPFGHSPDSTPSLSEDISDFDDDDEHFQLPMSAHSMPAHYAQVYR